MEGFFRRPRPISDARPPTRPSPRAELRCARCSAPVSSDQAVDRGEGIEHLLCEPSIVSDLDRRLEASRALHRALGTLGGIEPLRAIVLEHARELSDVADPTEVLALLERLRTAVEVTRFARPEQRKLSLHLIESLSARLVVSVRATEPG